MANLQIKNVPEPLHEELRRRAAQREMTVRDYVLQLIIADQSRPSAKDWFDALATHEPVGLTAADILVELDRGRADRGARPDAGAAHTR